MLSYQRQTVHRQTDGNKENSRSHLLLLWACWEDEKKKEKLNAHLPHAGCNFYKAIKQEVQASVTISRFIHLWASQIMEDRKPTGCFLFTTAQYSFTLPPHRHCPLPQSPVAHDSADMALYPPEEQRPLGQDAPCPMCPWQSSTYK